MLTKREKVTKTKQEELDLKSPLPSDSKKQKNNRLFVTIILGLTVLLCLSFFAYRNVQNMVEKKQPLFSVLHFDIPVVSKKSVYDVGDIDRQVNKIVLSSPGVWSIYAEIRPTGKPPFIWSRNYDSAQTSSLYQILTTIPPSTNTSIASILPEGVEISEKIDTSDGITASFLIHLPQKPIFISLKNSDKTASPNHYISSIVDILYWNLVSME